MIALLILEICVRFSFLLKDDNSTIPDQTLNHIWKPLSMLHSGQDPESYSYSINQFGWIFPSTLSIEKQKKTFRIFLLGDSFTESTTISELSLHSTLIRFFAKHYPGLKVEVINCGTSSYSPLIHRVLLSKILPDFKPDLIIINVDMTDVFDDYIYSHSAIYDQNNHLIAVSAYSHFAEKYLRVKDGVLERNYLERFFFKLGRFSKLSALINKTLVEKAWFLPPLPELPKSMDWLDEPWSSETDKLVENTLKNIEIAIKTTQNDLNAKIVISSVPHLPQITGKASKLPHQKIKEVAIKNGASYIDLLSYFEKRADNISTYYIANDMHMNRYGYMIWAEALEDFFLANSQLIE